MMPRRWPLTDCDRELIGVHDFAKSFPKGHAEKMQVCHQQELALPKVRKVSGEVPRYLKFGGFRLGH